MQALIWIGGLMCLGGLAGLIWCMRKAVWLRKAELDEAEIRTQINGLVFAHMASIGVARKSTSATCGRLKVSK